MSTRAALRYLQDAIASSPEPEHRKLLHQASVLVEKVQSQQPKRGTRAVVQKFYGGGHGVR